MAATSPVILVDAEDHPVGTADKLEAHRLGLCHRAFSVFIFRNHPEKQVLLQQRAFDKYHSGGLWTNACCSHPRPNEEILQAGQRRIMEEMGIEATLKWAGRFHYHVQFRNNMIENEVDHVLTGTIEHDNILMNPAEVQAFRWVSLPELQAELVACPEKFTYWFRQALEIAIAT